MSKIEEVVMVCPGCNERVTVRADAKCFAHAGCPREGFETVYRVDWKRNILDSGVGDELNSLYEVEGEYYLVPWFVELKGFPGRTHIVRVPKSIGDRDLITEEEIGAAAHIIINEFYAKDPSKDILEWPNEIELDSPTREVTGNRLAQFIQNRRRRFL